MRGRFSGANGVRSGRTCAVHTAQNNLIVVANARCQTAVRFDVHESVHRDIIVKITNKMQLYRLIYYSKSALHVSADIFAHHQEHLTVFTVSGIVHPSCCLLVSWMN